MYTMPKRLAALLLCLVILAGMLPTTVHAADQSVVCLDPVVHINPLYADILTEEDLFYPGPAPVASGEEDPVYLADITEAAKEFRAGMVARQDQIIVHLQLPAYDPNYAYDIPELAMAHTGVPNEGDYLMWQYGGWRVGGSYYTSDGVCYLTLTYALTYYTTAAQEAQVTLRLAQVLADLGVSSTTDLNKIRAIYDYLCENVVYDYANLGDSSYLLKHTAYAALINGTSVCQGYALLFYRMALELGLECRLITGYSNGEGHAWNIVKLGDLWYNLDSTWDAGQTNYAYYLRGSENFPDHTRGAAYTTEDFNAMYPTSETDYVEEYPGLEVVKTGTCGPNIQ